MADRKLARGGRKCIVTQFEARGLKDLLEPWRCVRAGGAWAFWNRGDAVSRLGPRKFSGLAGPHFGAGSWA